MIIIKYRKIIGAIIIFLLCIPLHFLYEKIPSFLTAIISPVNESIWEHMKLIFYSFLFYSILEYFFTKKKDNNFYLSLFLSPLIGIILYLIIFIPIYQKIGENMFLSIGLLLCICFIMEGISYSLLTGINYPHEKKIGLIGLISIIIIFTIFTYFPLKNFIFIDPITNTYGIFKLISKN